MTHPPKPTLATRLRAAVAGEQATASLEALRAAGLAAYDEWMAAERLRAEQVLVQSGPWAAAPGTCSQLLAAWNAFALQTLGEAMLDADYLADQGTVGYVPISTYDQVFNLLSAVQSWISRAKQAGTDPGYDLAAQIELPVTLPAWVKVDPLPTDQLIAMLSAASTLRVHAEAALHALGRTEIPEEAARGVKSLKQLAAQAATSLDYARTLHGAGNAPSLRKDITRNLKRALELWYCVGQMVAMPGLLSRPSWKHDADRLLATGTHHLATNARDTRPKSAAEMIRADAAIVAKLFEAAHEAGGDTSLDMEITVRQDGIRVHLLAYEKTSEVRMGLLTACAGVLGAQITKNTEKPFAKESPYFKVTGTLESRTVSVSVILNYRI